MNHCSVYKGFPGGTSGKEFSCNSGDSRWIPLGQEDTVEKGMATHFSILAWGIPWRGAWWATVHGVAKSQLNTHTPCLQSVLISAWWDGWIIE